MQFIRPSKPKSAQVQAELYHACKVEGIECHLEYTCSNCRFDAIIIKGDRIMAIVECKSHWAPNLERSKETKQFKKYSQFGVPVLMVLSIKEIPSAIAAIKDILSKAS